MATSIVSPTQTIDQSFGNIYSMMGAGGGGGSGGGTNLFGANLSGAGGGAGTFGVSTPSSSNPNNVALYAQLAGLGSAAAPAMLTEGGNLVGTGMGVTQGGLDMSGTGFGTTGTALNTLQPALAYYNALMSGNPATMTAALAPTAAQLSGIESGALGQATQGPEGGETAAIREGLPQTLAGGIINQAEVQQANAATQLQNLAGVQNTIANTQGNIGGSVAGTGQQAASTGTTMMNNADTFINNLISQALQKVNLNNQTNFATQFGQITTGIGNLLGGGGKLAEGINT